MSAQNHTRESGAQWAPLRWVIFLLLAMLPALSVRAMPAQGARIVVASPANQVAVTTTMDIVDGDTSTFARLNSQPGLDGAISLREALLAANTTPTATLALTITFSIPITDTGYDATNNTWTIPVGGQDSTALPPLARGNLRIDGTTQPGTSSHPRIVLDGYDVYEADGFMIGLTIISGGNTVRGLALANFYDISIVLSGAAAANNQIVGCYIGTDALGLNPQTYGLVGVEVRDGAHDNLIGGSTALDRNLISGTKYWGGVWIRDATTTHNTVAGNWIGVDATGQVALPNVWAGISISDGAHHNIVGGAGQGNVIAGNDYGIYIEASSANTIAGNIIGLPADGIARSNNPVGNQGGIIIADGAHDNLVGGTAPGARNIISGNDTSAAYGQGVYLYGANTTNNTIQGNYIGVDVSGIRPAGNRAQGVLISNSARGNTIGGTAPGAGNVITYNGAGGIWLGSGSNLVAGNLIGVGADRSTALPNQQNGVGVQGDNNIIGPDNLIAYSLLSGIKLNGANTTIISNTLEWNRRSGICVAGASARIRSNTIIYNGGFVDSGIECNIQGGVVITGTAQTEIISNTIQNNTGAGITVRAGAENRILSNSISNNSTVGILLLDGGNGDIAPPTIARASSTIVAGTSCPSCYVEIFTDDDDEGRKLITATTALTNGAFVAALQPGVIDLPHVTATSTDSSGNTSPFAAPVAVGSAPPPTKKFIYLPQIVR
ncbi:MAG: right-handed parallel beta-helix repeat-containing protein [Roseiflexaceae bacterium]